MSSIAPRILPRDSQVASAYTTSTTSFSYDTLNHLTSSPLGSYSYGDSAHVDAATSVDAGSPTWSASYDASGNMTYHARQL